MFFYATTPWQDKEYEELVMLLFDSTPKLNKENLRLDKITLSLLRGGRSSVTVLKLEFIHRKQPHGFIIRIHINLTEAEQEKNYADKLDINSIDCFANCMGKKELAGKYLIIYQDVELNMVTKSIDELGESLFQRLSCQNEFTVFAHNFQTLFKNVTQSFEKIANSKTNTLDEYCDDSFLSQLPPELVINQFHLRQFDNLIFESQASSSDAIEPIIDVHQFIRQLSEKDTSTQWFKLNKVWFDKEQGILSGDCKEIAYLPFTIEENSKVVYVWIAINKNELKDIESKLETMLDATYACQLTFLAEDVTFIAQLKKMGFDSCLSTSDFQTLCEKQYFQLHLYMRHNDLHCGNVLTSGNSFKVIDVGDMREDLIACDMARLEVSLWFEMSKQLPNFSVQEAETVIENLMNVSNSDSLSISTRFSDFLHHLNQGFEAGVKHLPAKEEIILAYVIQILLYQRYSLLDGVKIPPAFNVFARHWISQFRYNVDFTKLSSEVREVIHHLESLVDRKLVTWDVIRKAYTNSIPKRYDDSPNFSKNAEQNCFKAIYSIAVLPLKKENPPLVKFSCYIADALADSKEHDLLNNLIAKHFTPSCPSQISESEQASNCDLWVVVSNDRLHPDCYSLSIGLDKEVIIPEIKFIKAEKFRTIFQDTLKQAYSELMSHLDIMGLCAEHVWIRFILPRSLLLEAVDQYELGEIWGTFGTEFKITVGLWERVKYPHYSASVRNCWMKYKKKMANEIRCADKVNLWKENEICIPAFIVNNSDSPRKVFCRH